MYACRNRASYAGLVVFPGAERDLGLNLQNIVERAGKLAEVIGPDRGVQRAGPRLETAINCLASGRAAPEVLMKATSRELEAQLKAGDTWTTKPLLADGCPDIAETVCP